MSPRSTARKKRSDPPRRRAVFTIVSANYIAFAATLMQSVRTFHPEAARYIVLADTYREFPDLDLAAEVLVCDDIGIEVIDNMKLWYTVIEFNTAIKPFVIGALLDRYVFDEVVYLDPDILLFRPLVDVFEGLGAHNIVLTPHMMHPLQDGKEPSDHTIMKSGIYNLGFLGVHNDPDARRLIDWWADRCFLDCRVDIPGHMFTDQRWMDLAPVFVPNPMILRHPGYNVAYWNLANRRVEQAADGTWLVNGQKLAFFHFSGINPQDPTVFSKHQNRFSPANLGPVASLCDMYRQRVMANGWAAYARTRYGFGAFPDGRPIEDAMRHWLRRMVDNGRIDSTADATIDSRFFDHADEEAAAKGATLTRFMYQYWLDRSDLQEAFNIFTPHGVAGYFEWFINGDARKQGVDGRSIAAARRISGRAEPERLPVASEYALPPWPSVSRQAWQGPSHEAARFLEGHVAALLDGNRTLVPMQVALLWELRSDLQLHFPLKTADRLNRFLAWALTNGITEGTVDCDEFSAEFLQHMAEDWFTEGYYPDVPITRGLVATRFLGSENKCYESRRRFPVERAGRLAHGLWFTYVAARQFNWPREFVAPLLSYFETAGDVEYDGFRLTNVMLAIWELRPDVQQAYPLDTEAAIGSYLVWLLTHGLREMEISMHQLGSGFRDFLLSESPRLPGFERIFEILYAVRSDLQRAFDLGTESGREDFDNWRRIQPAGPHDEPAIAALFSQAPLEESPPEPPVYMAAVALTGQWSAPTGRGEDVRCSAISLHKVGFSDFFIVDSESHQILRPDGSVLPKTARVVVQINIVHLNADTAYSDWQLLRTLRVSAKVNVGFWAWELERLPSYWRCAFTFYDEIWASTRFAHAAFSLEKLRPVRLMPMAVVAPEVRRDISRRKLNLPADATVFLFVFDFRSFASRKNPEAVVRAFQQAFPSGDEKAFLVIKTMGADENCGRLEQLAELCTDPRISLRDIKLDRDELIGLIRASNAFVSLHRSEGFGRGPAEAMLLGCPTILTGYSGTSDFSTAECAYVVDYELVPVVPGEYPGVEGQRWANANVAMAARHMRHIHERPDEARRIGELGRAQVMRLLDPHVIGQKMRGALSELLERSERERALKAETAPDRLSPAPIPPTPAKRLPRRRIG